MAMDREQRRAQILAVATAVFAEKGYHDARIDDIVVRAPASVVVPCSSAIFHRPIPICKATYGRALFDERARQCWF